MSHSSRRKVTKLSSSKNVQFGSHRSTVHLQQSDSFTHVANPEIQSGRRMVPRSLSSQIAVTILSLVSMRTIRHRFSISNRRLRVIQAPAGRLTVTESHL